jgi:hypothetical protein
LRACTPTQTEVDMAEREKKSAPDNPDRAGQPKDDRDAIIPGRHGKHGGGLESEGAPQEPAPEANRPRRHNGADHTKH